METLDRPAARMVCLDAADRVLLLHWRDPVDGTWLWEPPGGGIDPGETPLMAARRELVEEAELGPGAVLERSVPVEQDVCWKGVRYVSSEYFFVARLTEERPSPVRVGLLPDDQYSPGGVGAVRSRGLPSGIRVSHEGPGRVPLLLRPAPG
ncbi:NUDIX domain-containing protein [Streptomyces decoyicus]